MNHRDLLLRHARQICLPYLLNLPEFASHLHDLSFVPVGSVAAGLCTQSSDIDIAVVCTRALHNEVSQGKPWGSGRPSEVVLDGIQLYHFSVPLESVQARMASLDDVYLHEYGNAIVLYDPANTFTTQLTPYMPSKSGP